MPKGSKGGSKGKGGKGSIVRKMKAKKGGRKKMADTFLKKEWFVIKVPTYLPTHANAHRVGFSPATKGKSRKAMENRAFVINVGDLQDEAQKNDTDDVNWKKFTFITEEVFGDKLLTQWNGMKITRDKRCSLIRKWRSMIEAICDAKTQDGYVLRVKVIAFTKRQLTQVKKSCYAKRSQVRNIRATMRGIIRSNVSSTDLKGVVKRLSESTIGTDIRKQCQLTFPLKACLVEKVKVMKRPKKDAAKLMSLHDLQTGFDEIKSSDEEESEDDDQSFDDSSEYQSS